LFEAHRRQIRHRHYLRIRVPPDEWNSKKTELVDSISSNFIRCSDHTFALKYDAEGLGADDAYTGFGLDHHWS